MGLRAPRLGVSTASRREPFSEGERRLRSVRYDRRASGVAYEAWRQTRRLDDMIKDEITEQGVDPNEFEAGRDLKEIDNALETHLGAELQALVDAASGQALWDGNWENIHVRRATGEEAERWGGSSLAAMQAGEQEPGETDWVAFLVDVVERD
jgi:hypothetical protein